MKKNNLLGLSVVALLSGIVLGACAPSVEPTPEPTTLGKVTELSVVRNEDKWYLSFTGVEHASGYSLTILQDDDTLKKETLTTTSYTMDPIAETATFTFSVYALGNETEYLNGEAENCTYSVYCYNEEVHNNVSFTGVAEEGAPIGEFTLKYEGGDVYVGTLYDNFTRKHGKHTYSNNMYYEGDFVNDQFEGEGMFTWSTTGDWHDSNTYIGNFVAGGFNDQTGTYYCAANWSRTNDYAGLIYWTGVMGPTFGIAGKIGETGKGAFQFANNSVYEGDLKVTGDWAYVRDGFGWNKWIVNETSPWITGGSDTLLIDGFEGVFSEAAGGWILGDGIWYFKDAEGNPVNYIKGCWNGGTRTGDATTELTVRDGYTSDMEIVIE